MFKRIMYFFVIFIAVFVLSFITREIVVSTACRSGDSKSVYREFDGMDSGHILPISNESEPELYGGLVIAAEGGTPHGNFYVSTYNGHVAVYNRFGSLCRETTRTVDSLDKRIRELIHKHVYFNDIDDMNRFIDSL